ncbi:MAG TPA: putative transporter [Armatimonadota bacterium]|nr:putative transporter [Armatimonadota bacterium]
MNWLTELFHGATVANAVLILSLVTASGLVLGNFRIAGVGLGISGVLFTGIIFGNFRLTIDPQMLDFARDFGLILFLYSIGAQVGPGILESLRRQGLPLNLLAVSIVLTGAELAVLISRIWHVAFPVAVGLFTGATTNIPSLAAAQQAMRDVPGFNPSMTTLAGLGCAGAYPFGVIGTILTMILLRSLFRVNLQQEAEALEQAQESEAVPKLERMNLRVTNTALEDKSLRAIVQTADGGVVVSRLLHAGQLQIARPDMPVHIGDILLAVGRQEKLDTLCELVGEESATDLTALPSEITTRQLIVTRAQALGKTVEALGFLEQYGVTITRIIRSGMEFTPHARLKLQFGDTVLAVGDSQALDEVARELGNSAKELNHAQIVPIFLGIALGVFLGSWPITVPGIPAPVKLGLAGGPLVVAIVLSRIGRIGPLIWHMPLSANFILREVGITLFLASVGIRAGDNFVATLVHGGGFYWMGLGALITAVPLLVFGVVGRLFLKVNYLSLCGLLAGSMTNPPALEYITAATGGSEAPSVSCAMVYPLTMILRVLTGQLLVILFMH